MSESNMSLLLCPENLRQFCRDSFFLERNTNPGEPQLLTVLPKLTYNKNEAAMILGVTVSTINWLLRKKLLPHHKIGKHVRFTLQDLLEYLKKSKVES